MKSILALFFWGIASWANAQNSFIKEIQVKTDTSVFTAENHFVQVGGQKMLYFETSSTNQDIEITIVLNEDADDALVTLLQSPDFTISDSLIHLGNGLFRGKVNFSNLAHTKFPRFVFSIELLTGQVHNEEVKLYPFFKPKFSPAPPRFELFMGEEGVFTFPIENSYSLRFSNKWINVENVSYLLTSTNNVVSLRVKPKRVGTIDLELHLESRLPYFPADGSLTKIIEDAFVTLDIKPTQLNFIKFDQKNYFFEPSGSRPLYVQMDFNSIFKINKTYRIEDQQEPGGRLIAELFTRSIVENKGVILATLRTYALHKEKEGYLYIKDGDNARMFTNFNILTKPRIEKISILRLGKDWSTNQSVYPNEDIEIKVEGTGLSNSQISFGDGKFKAAQDTSRTSERAQYYSLTIDPKIRERKIPVEMNGNPTSFELLVKEHHKPHDLDFISINYGDRDKVITSKIFNQPVLFKNEIKDIIFKFDTDAIDRNNDFHGVQSIDIEIRITDKNKRQIEVREINNIKIVPGKTSARHEGHDQTKAHESILQLNHYLTNKTIDFKPWSKIEINIKHSEGSYSLPGSKRKIEIYRRENYSVDVTVSFPAGLFHKTFNGEPGIGKMSGISIASMAQFSFYKPDQINKKQPYTVGIGMIGLNAINSLSQDDDKDIGVIAIMAFQPLRSESKVNFPIYAGFGYLFDANSPFLLLGPGIRFNF